MDKKSSSYEMKSSQETSSEEDEVRKNNLPRVLLIKLLVGLCVLMCIAMIVCIIAVVIVSDNATVIVKKAGKFRQISGVKPDTYPPLETTSDHLTTRRTRTTRKPDKYKVCEEPHCKRQAADIEASLNRSVNPCDDFYMFTCGGMISKAVIPDDVLAVSNFDNIFTHMANISRELLETKIDRKDLDAIKKRKILYRSCLDIATIESRGLLPIMNFFKTHRLSWPIIDPKWSESTSTLQTQAVRYAQLGFQSLISTSVAYDPNRIRAKIVQISTIPLLTFRSKSNYNSTKGIGFLRELYKNISEILAPGDNHTQDIEDVIQYEIESSKLLYNPGEKPEDNDAYKRLTLRQLNEALPDNFIDIENATKQVLSFGSIHIAVTGDTPVYVKDYNMTLRNAVLVASLRDMNRTLMNAFGFAAIRSLIMFMPKNMTDISATFYKKLWDTSPSERWKVCSPNEMWYATTRMYADKYFPAKQKHNIDEMTLTIKSQMIVLISLNEWMDMPTKNKAIEKAQAMSFHNVYPAWILNDTFLNEYYRLYVFNESEALENMVRHKSENFVNDMNEYNSPNKIGWINFPLAVNAYYSPGSNSFSLLAGILQPPFYDINYLNPMNYGGIGTVIGHEITHGFDINGRNRDLYGRFSDWWTYKSRMAYQKKARCIRDQYSTYVNEQINKTLNADMSLAEDIADIGGLKPAFFAYQMLVKQKGLDKKLYGLEFTPNQLFFVQFARMFCLKRRYRDALRRWESIPYSAAKFRVIGSLSGFSGFVETFKCPRGSPMNNNKYCNLW